MSDMVKYRAVSFKKDQIAALYFTMSDIVDTIIYSKDIYKNAGNGILLPKLFWPTVRKNATMPREQISKQKTV